MNDLFLRLQEDPRLSKAGTAVKFVLKRNLMVFAA